MRKWTIFTFIILFLASCSADDSNPKEDSQQETIDNSEESNQPFLVETDELTIEHVHGIGYNDENELLVATHNGIKVYRDASWLETTNNLHDYMGFQVTKDGFYSSGHPENGSSLEDPLGLIKADQYGEDLNLIKFHGESDFHFLGASYSGQDIYIINEMANSSLNTGFYRSSDGGLTWKKPIMAGFDADTYGMIAVHPTQGEMVALATREGLFVSENAGDTFSKWTEGMITAIAFSGEEMVYATVSDEGDIGLHSFNLSNKKSTPLPIPFLDYDNPITYIAVSQQNPNQFSIVTYDPDILQTTDRGENWKPLLQDGKM